MKHWPGVATVCLYSPTIHATIHAAWTTILENAADFRPPKMDNVGAILAAEYLWIVLEDSAAKDNRHRVEFVGAQCPLASLV